MLNLTRLRTLSMDKPLGIGEEPYFSWVLESDEQNTMQTAYRITVSNEDGFCVWDSGIVKSEQSAFVAYDGEKLDSRGGYSWTVTAWDNHGNEAEASSSFETALLDNSEWKAKWAEAPYKPVKSKLGYGKQGPSTLFRKSFIIASKRIVKARLYATCHGVYHLTVNGIRPDNREFAPEHTSYEKYLCYQTYDVTKLLIYGKNALGMHVGNGWYCGNKMTMPKFKGYKPVHAVLFQLEITYEDGSRDLICSGKDVRVSKGPVVFSDLYTGEKFDANLEIPGWDKAGFNDSSWDNANVADYGYDNLRSQLGEPVRPIMVIKPIKTYASPKGETMIDFGQNMAGRLRVRLDLPKGREVTFEHTEITDKEGNYFSNLKFTTELEQKSAFVSAGKAAVYEPLFAFHGFRYVRVTGLDSVDLNDFEAVVFTSEKENLGSFECSDDRLNRLYENIRWSQHSNMISIPTDCPHREKAGWTGDIQIYAATALLNEEMTAFLTRWLDNLACDQSENGAVPMVVPYTSMYQNLGKMAGRVFGNKGLPGSAGWGDAAVIVPWSMYSLTGNTSILRRQYKSMKRWCGYIIDTAASKRGNRKIPKEVDKYLWNTGFHFGEWLIPSISKGWAGSGAGTSITKTKSYIAPIFGWYSVHLMSRIAEILGEENDKEYYGGIARKMKEAIAVGVINKDGNMPVELQGAYVLMLYFDLVPEKLKQKFIDRLLRLIYDNGGCLDTGFLATPFIIDALCNIGRRDMAYKLLFQTKCPSWLYEIEHGATTIWESWNGYDNDGEPLAISYNHYAFGCVADWIFRYINGIDKTEPGFKHIVIKPQPDDSLSYAKRTYMCEYGLIVSEWKKEDGKFILNVMIPCNTTATIVLPDGSSHEAGSGSYTFTV